MITYAVIHVIVVFYFIMISCLDVMLLVWHDGSEMEKMRHCGLRCRMLLGKIGGKKGRMRESGWMIGRCWPIALRSYI